MTKLKNSNFDKTQKLKLWQNSKTQIGIKLCSDSCDSSYSCDTTDSNDSSDKKNSFTFFFCLKAQIVFKVKNSNFDQTHKNRLWQDSKTQIVTKLLNSNFEKKLKNSNCDETQKHK